ncbi:MAG: M20/M25/M40 family metallo-hydrolase [Eggerthellaceae bacterium]|nr:M20/M25/M40 family metallo-hydrolase [Eggerthellaceae bacterium]
MNVVLWILGAVLALLVVLVAVVLVRSFSFKAPTRADASLPDRQPQAMSPEALQRLQAAIRIPTVSFTEYETMDFEAFRAFKTLLRESFPLFHQTTSLEEINEFGLVYRWQGSDAGLAPMAFMAHYDVVPVEPGTEDDWLQPPFSGAIADGEIWGRGSLDIKSQLLAYLEAAEKLIGAGFVPSRDLYFCFGHDEEVGGHVAASPIVECLQARGIAFESVLDEGGLVITGAMKGIERPLGLIGIAEKGHVDYMISVFGEGGHSSMPPRHSALGLASRLVVAIEDHPMPLRLTPSVEAMLRNIAGELGFPLRMAISNLWLFRPLLLNILSKDPTTNALVRSTCAATMAQASNAHNVLPQVASVNINVRLLPGDSSADVLAHIERLAARLGIERFKIELAMCNEASETSEIGTPFLKTLTQLLLEFYPSALVTPYLVMGGTDARYYSALSSQVYRLTPTHITDKQRDLVHNSNERLDLANYFRMIEFYERLFQII